MTDELTAYLDGFASITLDEMDRVRLMNRTDTKFVTTMPALICLLRMTQAEYRVQEVNGRRRLPYYSCYFDTPECSMLTEHVRGRKARQKVRIRRYEDSGTTFLEVKDKNNHGRTRKTRTLADKGTAPTAYTDFLHACLRYDPASLLPRVENRFSRITLVNNGLTERLTIDTALQFINASTKQERELNGLVIIELKRNGRTCSPAAKMLRELHIHPCGFSKYCIGMALTGGTVRTNLLKPRLHRIGRLLPDEQII